MGRPTTYNETITSKICGQIVEGKSLRTICKADDMPDPTTVYLWLTKHKEFSQQYTKAKEDQAEALIEEIQDIADDGTNDWMEVHDKDGACIGYKFNGEHYQRSRLRVDTRKWIAGKMRPKKYGDRQILAGDKDAPLNTGSTINLNTKILDVLTTDQLERLLEVAQAENDASTT